uniref:Apple domain-containing protein n=1 Tax=Kalanchoe fedtschenkoi TaxID=63787 RepID=A0A7N0UJU8_KALFE
MSDCNVYGKCGAFGSCNAERDPICSCLPGFEPKKADEWNMGNWTNGCIRRSPLKYERIDGSYVGESGEEDRFLWLQMMKVPDFSEWEFIPEEECRPLCFGNWSCLAYAYDSGIGCMTWSHEHVDPKKFSGDATSLYLRVAHSELGWKRMSSVVLLSNIGSPSSVFPDNNIHNKDVEHNKVQEVMMFSFEVLSGATNNFDAVKVLVQGGFGPVYMVAYTAFFPLPGPEFATFSFLLLESFPRACLFRELLLMVRVELSKGYQVTLGKILHEGGFCSRGSDARSLKAPVEAYCISAATQC